MDTSHQVTISLDTANSSNAEENANQTNIGYVPTPTREYAEHRKANRSVTAGPLPPLPIPIPIPIPIPLLRGPRALIWKQDPSVAEIGVRKVYLPNFVSAGPHDARIQSQGLPSVTPNVFGDFIETPGTDAFDAVHAFAVVRESLTMVQRALGGVPMPWQWNSATNTDPISVFAHAGSTMNAFYSRNEKALKFFYFTKPGDPPTAPLIYTCRSLDIVSHETGHAILDGMKPHWIEGGSAQTGALHESFGDQMAIFVTLSQLDQVEAVIAQTKANLHDKTFLSDLAEQFGLALGRPNGLRNADNNLKLSEVTTEVHALSQVFTGAIYDVLADIFNFETRPALKDHAVTLSEVARYLLSLVLRALQAAPNTNANFADVANQMLLIANADGKPAQYRNFIRNRFTLREVVVSSVPFEADHKGEKLKAVDHPSSDPKNGRDLRGCSGTMTLPEYNGIEEIFDAERAALRSVFSEGKGRKNDRPVLASAASAHKRR